VGGSWTDLGPHLIDQAVYLFGKPRAITLQLAALREGAPAPDFFHAVLAYDAGPQVILHSSKLAADHNLRFAVHGTRGSWIKHGLDTQEAATVAGMLPIDPDWGHDPIEGVFTPGDEPGVQRAIRNEAGDYRRFWQRLTAAIRGDGPNPVSADEALTVMEVIDAGIRSADLGMTIAL
jgi:predicted dehydrogenase